MPSTTENGEVSFCDSVDVNDFIGKLPLDKVIGEPLNAAIRAQGNAAKSILSYIKDVGVVNKDGKEMFSTVCFSFTSNGKPVKIRIPLITLVPIPTLGIDTMTYDFKVTVKSSTDFNFTQTNSFNSSFKQTLSYDLPKESAKAESTGQTGQNAGSTGQTGQSTGASGQTGQTSQNTGANGQTDQTSQNAGSADKNAATGSGTQAASAKETDTANKVKSNTKGSVTFDASYSTKKDSTSTKDSKYSVEATIDINVTLGKDDMPTGISKILEILNESTELINPNGELSVSSASAALSENNVASLTAQYKDENGNLTASAITCAPHGDNKSKVESVNCGDYVQFIFSKEGIYEICAGSQKRVVEILPKA